MNSASLLMANYMKEESEMSDQKRKIFKKYDKEIDKEHEKIKNDLTKRQAKYNDEIEDAKEEIDILEDKIKHPAKMTEYLGIVIALLGLILQLIDK
jgi:septal ring factor EnvC (AmiA/AmiB activator)